MSRVLTHGDGLDMHGSDSGNRVANAGQSERACTSQWQLGDHPSWVNVTGDDESKLGAPNYCVVVSSGSFLAMASSSREIEYNRPAFWTGTGIRHHSVSSIQSFIFTRANNINVNAGGRRTLPPSSD